MKSATVSGMRAFGEGSVTEIKDGKKDYEVTVDFDGLGVRKMLACFAKLEKLTS